MILLTSTTDKLQLTTGSAASIGVHASYVDNNAGTIMPDRTNTPPITTATTTDIVAAPAAGVQRNVKGLYIVNTHASASTQVTVSHTDGTNTVELMGVTLLPGENLNFTGDGEWKHRDAQGGEYLPGTSLYTDAASGGYTIASAFAESVPRHLVDSTQAGTSGTMYLAAVYLRAGQKVSNISFFTTVATGTPTHGIFGLYSSGLTLLASSVDFTTEAWAASTIKTKALTAPYTVPTTGLYYLAVMVAATTAPTYAAKGTGNTTLKGLVPSLSGSSSTALTTTLPASAAAITAQATHIWGAVS